MGASGGAMPVESAERVEVRTVHIDCGDQEVVEGMEKSCRATAQPEPIHLGMRKEIVTMTAEVVDEDMRKNGEMLE